MEAGLQRLRADFGAKSWDGAGGKLMPLAQAIRQHIRPGTALHLAYSDARPNAAVLEIVRQFDGTSPGFVLSTAGFVSVQHALVARGLVKRLITSFAGENYPAPKPSRTIQTALADQRLEIENWSLWTIVARLIAGALGVEYLPVNSILGSDMEVEHSGTRFARVDDPFGGDEPIGVVRAYRPDVTIVQGIAADPEGNVVMAPPTGEAFWGAMAARLGVIACVERIVDPATMREHNTQVTIPAHVVRAVCEVPFGSHPYGLYNPAIRGIGSYVHDHEFIVALQEEAEANPALTRWIEAWVTAPRSHTEYLAKLGKDRLARLQGEADPASWEFADLHDRGPVDLTASPATNGERMVVAASHVIADRVRSADLQAVLAGVGFANLAAWLAARSVRAAGGEVQLMAEIGMFGYDPRPGEPFIFSLRNLPACTLLTDVSAVLGTFIGGPGTRALGAIGAAQVDREGRVNSTWTDEGRFIVGSGGANDIASAADEVVVVVKHGPTRLVEAVPYVTGPGDRVRCIVTSEGVLERSGSEFELTRYIPRQRETGRQTLERIRSRTGWDLKISNSLAPQPEPTESEIQALRRYDPRGSFS